MLNVVRRSAPLLAPLVAGLTTAAAVAAPPPPSPSPADAGDADFAAAVYTRVATAAGRGNVFLSPGSVRTALSMTAAGAAGQTRRQMDAVLHLPAGGPAAAPPPPPAVDGCKLDVANALWVDRRFPFRPAFLADVKAGFDAAATPVDFAGGDPDANRQRINAWVADHTAGKIKDLLPTRSVRRDTRLVLTNAVHFKGDWADPFPAHNTADRPFHLDAAHDATVKAMRRGAGTMAVYQSPDVSAVELPYQGGAVSMVVVIPTAVDGLAAVERGLTGDAVRRWVAGLQPTEATLVLPRFTATAAVNLADTLRAMGMTDAFDPARADFSAMVDSTDPADRVVIGGVYHKAFVAVDEKGTEAAAATGVTMGLAMAMAPRQTVDLVADHPFLYLIRDCRTGAVLFIGRCADPRS